MKISDKNIENPKIITMKHELKNEGHFLREKKQMILRAVGRSENLRGPVLMWRPDLPKSGSAKAPPAPTGRILVEDESKVTEDVLKFETEMSDKKIEQFKKFEWKDSWQPEITKKQIIENIQKRIRA